jgi:hypothetical protein
MDFRNLPFQSHWSNHYKHNGFSLNNKHHGQIVVVPMVTYHGFFVVIVHKTISAFMLIVFRMN